MKKLFTLTLLFTVLITGKVLALSAPWSQVYFNYFFGGDSCNTSFVNAIKNSSGHFVIVGSSACNNKGDVPAADSLQLGYNIYVLEIDDNNKVVWAKVYGGNDSISERGVSLCQTSDSGYAIVSTTMSTKGNVSNSYGKEDIWLLKLDKNGDIVYEKTFGSSESDYPISVKEAINGGLIILGATNGNDNDIVAHYGDSTTKDWVLIKTDTSGNKDWVKVLGGTGDEGAEGELLVVDTSYYLVSNSNSIDKDCNDTSWFNGQATGYNYHLLKLDTAGAVLWDRSYGGSDTDKANTAIVNTANNRIVMAGFTQSYDMFVNDNVDSSKLGWVVFVDLQGDTVHLRTVYSTHKYNGKTVVGLPQSFFGNQEIVVAQDMVDKNGRSFIGIAYLTFDYYWNSYGLLSSEIVSSDSLDRLGAIVFDRVEGSRQSSYFRVIGTTADAPSFKPTSPSGQLGVGDKGFITSVAVGWSGSVNEIGSDGQLTIAPNPAGDYVTVEVSGRASGGNVMLLNMQGAVVMQKEMPAKKIQLNTSSLPRGMYMIQYTDKKNVRYVSKLILQ